MKPQIFKDENLQKKFDEDGYVVTDFINEEEASEIARKFYELHTDIPKGFYSASYTPDDAIKEDIYRHTHAIFKKVVEEKFQDYKILGSTFLCKSPGEEGKVNVHQDWTVVDETKYYSITIWVPVIDTDEKNGALMVLPGSHLFFNAYRSNNIPISYKGNQDLLWKNMITVPMKAGQAFILNHAVIHASAPNTTEKERLVIAYAMVPKDAPLMFYHKEPNLEGAKVEKYDMPDDFFQKYYNPGHRPEFGTLVQEMEYDVAIWERDKINNLINTERAKRGLELVTDENKENANNNASFWKRIKNWF